MGKIFCCFLLFVFYQHAYSQDRSLIIQTVDNSNKPIGNVIVYLDNDSVTYNENQLFSKSHSNWRQNKLSTFVLSKSDTKGVVNFNKYNYLYIHALRFGYEPSLIKIDNSTFNYKITLKEKVYDFPSLRIYNDISVVEWNHYGEEFYNSFVEYRFKQDKKVGNDGVEYEVADSPESIVDSIYGSTKPPHAYPVISIDDYLKQISQNINSIHFKEIVIEFTILKSGKPEVISIEGISERRYGKIKEIFINTALWTPANYCGLFVEAKYRLKIIKIKNKA